MRVEALQRSGWLEINDDSSFPAIPTCYSWVTMQFSCVSEISLLQLIEFAVVKWPG